MSGMAIVGTNMQVLDVRGQVGALVPRLAYRRQDLVAIGIRRSMAVRGQGQRRDTRSL